MIISTIGFGVLKRNAYSFAATRPNAAWLDEYDPPLWANWFAFGGRKGRILRVTNLAPSGPGSLREALEQTGARMVVFEVGGVVDLEGRSISINSPDLTVAGQTAPSPGITLIRGGLKVRSKNVLIQHMCIRSGDLQPLISRFGQMDSLTTVGAKRVVIDHCSFSWATDENLSASGPRFAGDSLSDWRNGASSDVVFSNNIISEGLHRSTHPKGAHSNGTAVNDNSRNVYIVNNVYASNSLRNPLFKGGVQGAVINNLVYNPGTRGMHYALRTREWANRPHEIGIMKLIGNTLRSGPATAEGLALVTLDGDGDVEIFSRNNRAYSQGGAVAPIFRSHANSSARFRFVSGFPDLVEGLEPMSARDAEEHVLRYAGARPWARDAIDSRIMREISSGAGRIIDSQEDVGGYPVMAPTVREFDESEWNLDTMTPKDGLKGSNEP